MKKRSLHIFLYLLACSFLLSVTAIAQHKVLDAGGNKNVLGLRFKLLPLPRKVELLQEKPLSITDLNSVYLEGLNKKPVLDQPLSGLKNVQSPSKGVLTLRIANSAGLPDSREGYIMEIKNAQVIVTAIPDVDVELNNKITQNPGY